MRTAFRAALPAALFLAAALAGCAGPAGHEGVALGYFPNVTHAQALYGIETGLYARHLAGQKFTATQFNAGPTAVEALLSGQVDAAYVGPGPLINALAATGGGTLRVIAGAASGGARFIVRADLDLASDADLAGKIFASPQLANSQDISLKDWLRAHGHLTQDRGGDVRVVNAQNPDILALFQQDQIDGAWVPEPWATRLEREAKGKEWLDERTLWPGGKFSTTLLVATVPFLAQHADLVAELLDAHVEATAAVAAGNASTLKAVNDGIQAATGKALPDDLLAASLTKLNFTNDPLPSTLAAFGDKARGLGLLHGDLPPLPQAIDLAPLDAALARHGRPGVPSP